jgi:hypothetical protein
MQLSNPTTPPSHWQVPWNWNAIAIFFPECGYLTRQSDTPMIHSTTKHDSVPMPTASATPPLRSLPFRQSHLPTSPTSAYICHILTSPKPTHTWRHTTLHTHVHSRHKPPYQPNLGFSFRKKKSAQSAGKPKSTGRQVPHAIVSASTSAIPG